MAKKSITSLFVRHTSSSFPTIDGTNVLKVTRVAGAFRIEVYDKYTDDRIAEYYIGESIKDLDSDLKDRKIIIVQKNGLQLKTVWKGRSLEEGFGFLNTKYRIHMDPSYFVSMAASS